MKVSGCVSWMFGHWLHWRKNSFTCEHQAEKSDYCHTSVGMTITNIIAWLFSLFLLRKCNISVVTPPYTRGCCYTQNCASLGPLRRFMREAAPHYLVALYQGIFFSIQKIQYLHEAIKIVYIQFLTHSSSVWQATYLVIFNISISSSSSNLTILLEISQLSITTLLISTIFHT